MRTTPRLAGVTIERAPTFAPDHAAWDHLETTVGRALDDNERVQLVAICNDYLIDATAEASAPSVKLALESAGVLRDEIRSLLEKLAFRDSADSQRNDALGELRSLIDEAMGGTSSGTSPTGHTWNAIQRLGEGVTKAELVLSRLAKRKGAFRTGSAWTAWVGALAGYWAGVGNRVTASKHSARDVQDSAFVRFVKTVQAMQPAHQRHTRSGHISDEIAKALEQSGFRGQALNADSTAKK